MFKSLILRTVFKISTLITIFFSPNTPSQYRFFIRYFFIHHCLQLNFFYRDYIIRKPYKTIDYDGEFGPELKFVIPFAFWHFKNGTLKNTVSSKDTKELYFFSKNHQEKYNSRKWSNFNFNLNIPNSEDHNVRYNLSKWEQVPLKRHYKNELFKFPKPLLIVANKYNSEWNQKPINFLSIKDIEFIYQHLHQKYTIVYNRPEGSSIIHDNSELHKFEDKEFIRQCLTEIVLMEDLFTNYGKVANNFNHFQLLVYANCEKFISVHGGASVLASYFEGLNIIYSCKGIELFFNEFESFYPKLSGANIKHAKSKEQLRKHIMTCLC